MTRVRIDRLASVLCVLVLAAQAGGQDAENPLADDEQVLRTAGLSFDGPALVKLFHKRSPSAEDLARLRQRVKQLGDESYRIRQQAMDELSQAGRFAIPLLKDALEKQSLEVRRRAERCLAKLEENNDRHVVLAAARLLAARKTEGSVEALLRHIPYVDDAEVEEEMIVALAAVALKDGRAVEPVVAALQDDEPRRRAAAVAVVARAKEPAQQALAREYLKNDDVRLRWRAAEGLLHARDPVALPALIALLKDAPLPLAWQAEELLWRVAGEKAPQAALGSGGDTVRQQAHAAWQDWLKAQGGALDLAKLDLANRQLGYTLCVAWDSDVAKAGRLFEVDLRGRERWTVKNVNHPVDGHMIRGDRVLVAEQSGHRVTERDLDGNVKWEHKVTDSLVSCRRLANGNTWIVTYTKIMEVTPEGKELYTLSGRYGMISHAEKLRNGNIMYLAYTGQLVEIDPKGNELRKLTVDEGQLGLVKFEALPNGHFLVPQQRQGKVQELDAGGRMVWSYDMQHVNSATRLPSGNILLSSYGGRRVVEVTRGGRVVFEKNTAAGLLNASRR